MKLLKLFSSLFHKSATDMVEKELLEREIIFLLCLSAPLFGISFPNWLFGIKNLKKVKEEFNRLQKYFSEKDDLWGEVLGIFKIG